MGAGTRILTSGNLALPGFSAGYDFGKLLASRILTFPVFDI